jgi:ribosomal protein L11 methyltransferase
VIRDEQEKWYVVSVTVPPEASEAVEFAFNELDPSCGTEINNLRKDQHEDVVVKGYFDEEPTDDALKEALAEALRIYGLSMDSVKAIDRRVLGKTDWLYAWKQHWKPTEAGKFIITPPWEEVTDTSKIVIEIEPAMAFGTGTHDTTRLCLIAIGDHYQAGQSFLDVGTGTGILAIAAAKMGAVGAIGCDTDAGSIENARVNAGMNEVEGNIDFFVGSISDDTGVFDFVCANLTLDVITPLLPLLLEKSAQKLVLSGILREQEDVIVNLLKDSSAENFGVSHSGEWISVIVDRA